MAGSAGSTWTVMDGRSFPITIGHVDRRSAGGLLTPTRSMGVAPDDRRAEEAMWRISPRGSRSIYVQVEDCPPAPQPGQIKDLGKKGRAVLTPRTRSTQKKNP